MKIYRCIAVVPMLALMILGSCGHNVEKSEESAADIEAAQIEGREAARKFLNRPWADTIELQSQLLEARALSSKYKMAGKQQSADAFDSTFVSTLRTVNPSVAQELENARRNQK